MLDDSEWPLPDGRRRIAAAVGYFAVAKDMIPDKIPGIGLLDDANGGARDARPQDGGKRLSRVLGEYRDNEATLRGNKVTRADWLEAKRRQIFLRIKRRKEERRRHGSSIFGY